MNHAQLFVFLFVTFASLFYIVKEESNKETRIYQKVIPHIAPYLHLLKTETLDKIPGQEFKSPGSPDPNGKYAVSCYTIDWGQYDIVISFNINYTVNIIVKRKFRYVFLINHFRLLRFVGVVRYACR